jgi:hydrogenase expression/formation protein HypC
VSGDKFDAAVVGRVVEVTGQIAKVELGGGTFTQVNLAFVDVKVGDLVLVHDGYAIQVIDRVEAERTLKHWGKGSF